INLGRVFELWRIATQGLHTTNISGYVTAYKMTYSLDARIWNTYKESNNSLHKNFTGNRNTFNTSCNNLNNSYTTPLVARFVRIYPVTWVVHMCMRIELLGVPYNVNTSCSSTVCLCADGFHGDGRNCTDVDVAGSTTDNYLGIAIGLPVIAVLLILFIIGALLFTRYRRMHVIRRPKSPKQPGSRPSSTVIGQIDKLFDDERKLRDSVSLRSLQFSIPSVHPSLTALNNIGLSTKGSPYETLQA
ncbi:hypothetical protein QZH41_020143, partial [Actinostola sp. cb2023]